MLNIIKNFQNNLKENVQKDDTHADRVSERIVDKLIDDILVEVVSDIHRAYKMGYIDHISLRNPNDSDENNDVFYPETIIAKTEDINCPKCNKQIHASRFAIHLEKCMPTGRTSSRIASQRLANTSKECSYGNVSDEDDDWKSTPEKNKNVKKFDGKRKKDPVRKTKPYKTDSPKGSRESVGSTNQKEILHSLTKTPKENLTATKSIKEIQEPSADVWISPNKVAPLLSDDKVILFSNKCGVKSDHTGKFCGRSLRCNRHTDAERAEARRLLSAEIPMEGVLDVEDVDHSKSVLGNFSSLNITPLSSNSKKKERQKHSSSKV